MSEFRQTTLPNGLRIAAEIDSRAYSSSLGYFVHAGSRNEVDAESGLSHFLEHMMFKGTDRRSAADVNRELDELGGQGNAYTSEEQTVYYATVLPKFQDRLIDLLTDMMGPALDEGEFETERQVILEEIAKYEDQPPFGAFERSLEVYFGPRGLGRRVLGTSESIQSVTAQRMRAYFNRRYRPENIVLAATGNVDFDGLVAAAQEKTTTWSQRPNGGEPVADDPATVPVGIQLDRQLAIADASQAYLVRIGHGPSSGSDDRYAARALATLLGDDGGSRLFWELIDTGRAEVATLWPQEFTDTGAWFNYLVCAPDEMADNVKIFDDIMQGVVNNGVDQEELDQVINKAAAGCIMQSERSSSRLFSLGSRWLTHNEYVSIDDTLGKLRGLTVDAVSKAAQDYLTCDQTDILAQASGEVVSG
ncbi:M16 family metallopeptidase [Planctomycetes bacterium K23_9]|uniref:Protease 3 n=1 Tax=Stieleria marina TaxID=1930275 RepID=A0A517P2X2_9BACT|nr:Protease 3 precursor [Planctomycetes bacterium K23_9]